MFRNHLAHFLCLFWQPVAPIYQVSLKRWESHCHMMNVFGLYSFRQRVAPIYLKRQSLRDDRLGTGCFLWGRRWRRRCQGSPSRSGVAQVVFHHIKVFEVGVQVRVHQDRGVEEDGEGQVEVEREESEDQGEPHMHDMRMRVRLNELEPMTSVWRNHQDGRRLRALSAMFTRAACACLGLRPCFVDVICVMIVVFIARVDVVQFS